MPLQAYSVTETEENTGILVFATGAKKALTRGAHILAEGDTSYLECRRAPWADKFRDAQSVPASTAVANGWWFECTGCGVTIKGTYFWDAPNRRYAQVVGQMSGSVYCNKTCQSRSDARRRAAARAQQRMIQTLASMIKRRFPDADIVLPGYAYASERAGRRHVVDDASVKFNFPGMVYGPAILSMRRPRHAYIGPLIPAFACCNGDVAAFESYAIRNAALNSASPCPSVDRC